MRTRRTALELGMVLHAHVERLIGQLDRLDEATVGEVPDARKPAASRAARNSPFTSRRWRCLSLTSRTP